MGQKIRVAIIDNSIDSSVYTPVKHWRDYLDAKWDSFRAKEHHFPDFSQGHYSHLLLTGSEASILDREKWVEEEIEIIQEAAERNIPVLGSCWGHQLLAVIFAGPSYVRKSVKPEVGWYPLLIERTNYLIGEMNQAFVFNSHFDEVTGLDHRFDVFASTKDCPNHAFQLRGKPIWGIQSHPEMAITHARTYLKNNVAKQHDRSNLFAQALESPPRDSGLICRIAKNFLHCSSL